MIIPTHIILGTGVIIMILICKVKGFHRQSCLHMAILTGLVFILLHIIYFWGAIFLARYNLLPSAGWIEYAYIPFYPLLKWIDDIPNKEIEYILWGISLPLLWGVIGFILAGIIMEVGKIPKRG